MKPSETAQLPALNKPGPVRPVDAKPVVTKPVAPPVRKAKATRKPAKRGPAKSPEDLDRLARRLEADWQAALRKHEEAVNRKFRDLRAALHKPKAARLDGKAAARLRQALAPKLKPKKGRAKDLRRVEDALGAALARIP